MSSLDLNKLWPRASISPLSGFSFSRNLFRRAELSDDPDAELELVLSSGFHPLNLGLVIGYRSCQDLVVSWVWVTFLDVLYF